VELPFHIKFLPKKSGYDVLHYIKTANRFNAFKKTTFMITDAILKFVPFFSPEELNDVLSLKKNTSKKKSAVTTRRPGLQ
jgi:hypothetical protein